MSVCWMSGLSKETEAGSAGEQLAEGKIPISPQRAAELTQTMYEMTFRYPDDPEDQRILLQMDPEQRQLYDLIR